MAATKGGPCHKILLYHRVSHIESDPWSLCVTPKHFAEHLEVLRAYSPVRLDRVDPSEGSCSSSFTITFDDGYADNLYQAMPLLERYEIPATFFIATGYVEDKREFWWDELEKIIFTPTTLSLPIDFLEPEGVRSVSVRHTSRRLPLYLSLYEQLQPMDHEKRRGILDQLLNWSHQSATMRESHRVMTSDDVSALARSALVEIGAHTVTHPKLSSQSLAAQQEEIRESRMWLEGLLGGPVSSFSYPYGGTHHYSAETVRFVQAAGFSRACTTAARPVNTRDTLYELPRFSITDMSGKQFERLLFS